MATSSFFIDTKVLTFVSIAAKPQVLLVGQYSVGKTSFIRYLLGRDFPGQRIGPEPTTDRFTGKHDVLLRQTPTETSFSHVSCR
jgi:GTPase SAR1 family protein